MLTPEKDIIRYDGKKLAVTTCPPVQIEARRGRRWGWFGCKGWWIHLYLFHGWHMRKFVCTLAEAGVFLKHDSSLRSERESEGDLQQPVPSDSGFPP